MRKSPVPFVLACLLGSLAGTAGAAPSEAAASASTKAAGSDVSQLLAMSGEQRRAYLKQLSPEARRALRSSLNAARRDASVKGATSFYQDQANGTPVTAKPGPGWQASRAAKASGTIAYDHDFPSIGFGGGALVGNRFDTHTGIPVFTSGTVSTVQAVMVPGPSKTDSIAGVYITGPQTTMGGALRLLSATTPASGVIDSVTFSALGVNYTGNSFYVLMRDIAAEYIPVLGNGTALGQGHHAVVGYTGGMIATGITGTFDFGGAFNTFVRATGNIVPVELMQFSVD